MVRQCWSEKKDGKKKEMWKRWQGIARLYEPSAVVLAVWYGCQSKARSSAKRAQAGSRKRPKRRKADKLDAEVERK